jgi:uncharacterized DUF497 family protein
VVSDFSLEIEWDAKKAENFRKHGVSFVVADTDDASAHARIVSAREAKNSERQRYEES